MAIHINKHASKEHYKNETGSGRGKNGRLRISFDHIQGSSRPYKVINNFHKTLSVLHKHLKTRSYTSDIAVYEYINDFELKIQK